MIGGLAMGNLFEDAEPLTRVTVARDTVFKPDDLVVCVRTEVDNEEYGNIRRGLHYTVTHCYGARVQVSRGGQPVGGGFFYPAQCFELIARDGLLVGVV
jgi:hypothetical protein